MGRFLTVDCKECSSVIGDPDEPNVNTCDFCQENACDHCRENIWKTCPDCLREGCRSHFGGCYCHECIKEANQERN